MNKTQTQVLIVGLLAIAGLALLGMAYSIIKLPEEAFVGRIQAHGHSFADLKSFEEVVTLLNMKEEEFVNRNVEWTSERASLTLPLKAVGADPQGDDLYQDLLNFMEDAHPLRKIRVYLFGESLAFPLRVETKTIGNLFTDAGMEQTMSNAHFTWTDGKVIIETEKIGHEVDKPALASLIQSYWEQDWNEAFEIPASVPLPLTLIQSEIYARDLEPLLPQAEIQATRTYTFQDEYGASWPFPMNEHLDLLIPGDPIPEGTAMKIAEGAFIRTVELELVPNVESDPLPVIIMEKEGGGYSFQGTARFGREIQKKALKEKLENALLSGSEEAILLPITHTEPSITVPDSLHEKGVTDLLGYGYSSFKNSPANRIHNVDRGFEQFNGVLIEPGAEFSFTTLMGPIDATHGWLPELVIKGDETIPEYGGGMCQVSSTMFRAALYTGLPITARKNHSYAVSYYAFPYGYGLDATVYDPNPDLRFVNDTPGALLIQGYTEGTDAYFVFYGTNDGRSVQMEGPYSYDYTSIGEPVVVYTDELDPGIRELDEYAHTGFKVDWYRTVLYPTGSLSPYAASASGVRENIHSNYEARPAKYLEGRVEE